MLALGRTGNVRGDKETEREGGNKGEARCEWFIADALLWQHANTGEEGIPPTVVKHSPQLACRSFGRAEGARVGGGGFNFYY